MPDEFGLQPGGVDVAVAVLGDHHDVGDRLAPGQFVRVVLEGADEHDRAFGRRDVGGQAVPVVQAGRDPHAEDVDHLVDGRRGTRTGEDHDGLLVAADRVPDDLPGVLAQPGRLQPGAGRLGVGVGVPGKHLVTDEPFDEIERPSGGGVIGVRHPARPERSPHHLVITDD